MLGHNTLHRREGLLLELAGDDGTTGWGEASPLPGFSRESIDAAARQLHGLTRTLIGREPEEAWISPGGLLDRLLDGAKPAPSARFALELAIWNLHAEVQGETLPEVISPNFHASAPVNGLLSGTKDQVLEDARRMRDAGYETVKLKVGGRGGVEAAELVRALDEVLGGEVRIRLDANRAWDRGGAEAFARATEGSRYEYIEEPLADPSGLSRLAGEYGVPVALDESLVGMEPERLEEHAYARAVVLKPTLIGGISRTLRFARRASELGIVPVISAAYETGIGTLALISLAAGTGEEAIPAGLDTYRRLAADVLEPSLELETPIIQVRQTTGRRREIDRSRLVPYRLT